MVTAVVPKDLKMNLNDKYIFISDGTWFDKGTEVKVVDGICLWNFMGDNRTEWPDLLKEEKGDWFGLFEGKHKDNDCDQESCGLDEFEIKERV